MNKNQENPNQEFNIVIPDFKDWPIYKISQNKEALIQSWKEKTILKLLQHCKDKQPIAALLSETAFLEIKRIKSNRWSSDPDDDASFWKTISIEAGEIIGNPNEAGTAEIKLLERIVDRYTAEIVGYFDPSTYKFAKWIVDNGFAKLLNARARKIRHPKSKRRSIYDKIRLVGCTGQVRELAKKGTIVLVPTHFSNLDSLALGWGIKALGLPAFFYGAGLNLFNIKLMSYFMNRLGAYKLDRRKKNKIYLEVLKTYSTELLTEGGHSLFFPGGTRSRSGSMENRLKMGLLGTAIEAQRQNYMLNEKAGKIFIVPLILSYHFVLDAPVLINSYLKATGKEKYFPEKDPLSTSYKIFKFIVKFIWAKSEFALSIGQAMDVFGNPVNHSGNSLDQFGKPIEIEKYFHLNGKPVQDDQRDHQFTKRLAENIILSYKKWNYVLSSHVLAFVAYRLIEKDNPKMDTYELLRIPVKEITIDYQRLAENVKKLAVHLQKMNQAGDILIAPEIEWPVDQLIEHGIKNLGIYHAENLLKISKNAIVKTENLRLLLYYHNRLANYGFEQIV